jgi:putative flippase GtrA
VIGQLIRYGFAGAASALIYSAVYLALAYWVLPDGWAVTAVPPAFLAAASFGYVAHSRWSFRGHGTREPGSRRGLKFLVAQGAGMALNAAFTWLVTIPCTRRTGSPSYPA